MSILLWKTGMFNSEFGLLNQWMEALGHEAVRWLSTDVSAFICCTVVNLWLALALHDNDNGRRAAEHRLELLRERAARRGKLARAHEVYHHPVQKPIIAPAVIITVFTTFKQFDVVYLLSQQMGARTGSNFHTILTYAYENAFVTNNYGYSSAISIIIFLLMLAFSARFKLAGEETL